MQPSRTGSAAIVLVYVTLCHCASESSSKHLSPAGCAMRVGADLSKACQPIQTVLVLSLVVA